MLDKEYELLVRYLNEMIADGFRLVHKGHRLDWSDTKIPDILQKIEFKKKKAGRLTCQGGELLENRYSGQLTGAVWIDENSVQLLVRDVAVYPKDKLWYHYKKTNRGKGTKG